jgi:aryl-alcohol dehydrogenase-like predicted oxidoreductase
VVTGRHASKPEDVSASTFDLAGRPVHRVGFGAMQLPGPGVMGPPKDHDAAVAVLRRAVELGVDHIDTAQYYGPLVSNELIREALHPFSESLVLVSKVGARRDEAGGWIPTQQPDQLRADIEANLVTLGADRLGAVNLRLMGEHADDTAPPLDDQLGVMARAREDGLIEGIGISTATLDQVRQAHEGVGLACVQNPFSLVDQSDRQVLDYCTEHGIAYVPYFPLGSAFPNMPKVPDQPKVRAVATRLGVAPATVGLAWLLAQAPNVLLIPGTSSVAHLEENLSVRSVELSAEDLIELGAP